MADYLSPGDAASQSFDSYMMQRAALARQAVLDQIARQREDRMAAAQAEELKQGQELRDRQKLELQWKMQDRERDQTTKDVQQLVPGDIPEPDLVARAKKHGIPLRIGVQPSAPESMPGLAAVSTGQEQTGVEPTRTGPPVFLGSRADLDAKAARERMLEIAAQMEEGSPERQALEYHANTITAENPKGTTPPAGMFKKAGAASDTVPILRTDPARQKVQRLVNGVWADIEGDAPKGAHFLQEPQPKDNTAHDLREAQALQSVHDTAIKELDEWAKPILGQIDGVNALGTMINARTPQADTLIAPLVLKATVSGQGSGFRMTRAEIDNVLHGRSRWESLQAALNQWSADPTKALQITDEQRSELQDLAKAIRLKAEKQRRKIVDTRHDIDNAKDTETINKLRTRLQDELSQQEDDTPTAPMPSAADMIKEIRHGGRGRGGQ